MYRSSEILKVHLEVTSRCNAQCPQCPRNICGGAVNPNLPVTDLTVAQVKKILPVSFIEQLKHIYMCGNYGDPSVNRDLIAICKYIKGINPIINLDIHSNGSARSIKFWKELALLVRSCTFGIDGIADTNHIYRRNTIWSHVMRNTKAFIEAGGHAKWHYIVFRHNEHHVDIAKDLAASMGFTEFKVKRTARFLKLGTLRSSFPIMNAAGEVVGNLAPPQDAKYLNVEAESIANNYLTKHEYNEYINSTPISCKVSKERSIFISSTGLVFPCCWMAEIYPAETVPSVAKAQVHEMLQSIGGIEAINAQLRPLTQIIDAPFFQVFVPAGWKARTSERLNICARTCGKHKVSAAQWSENLLDRNHSN